MCTTPYAHVHYSICTPPDTEPADKLQTRMSKPVYEQVDVTILWNEAVCTDRQTDRQVTANRADIIIKNKKREHMKCGNATGQKCYAKGSRKEAEIREFVY